MSWMRFERGRRLDPIAGGHPEALVVLFHDRELSHSALLPIAERWSTAAPSTAFVAFDSIEQLDPKSSVARSHSGVARNPGGEPLALDRIARQLEPLIAAQRRFCGWTCAGVLALSPSLTKPLPRTIGSDPKIRSIDNRDRHDGLRDAVAGLVVPSVPAGAAWLARR
jgi:hypothetical protein